MPCDRFNATAGGTENKAEAMVPLTGILDGLQDILTADSDYPDRQELCSAADLPDIVAATIVASMSWRTGLILFLAFAALFLILNRPAYKGYFTDDDFDNLSWTRQSPVSNFVVGLLTPKFQTNNFRPMGHLFYRLEGAFFGFDFRKYLAATHLLHFLNVWLLWLLARRLGVKVFAASAACVFFAFHPGYFEAVWKPSYIFDILCATFCLLSLLSYVRGRWIVSLICFWLAYKSKEIAVMLPFVLACYERWFGEKRWKILVPFFAISAWFGVQALVISPNTGAGNDYVFHFTLGALAVTSAYYAGRVFLVPYLGFAVPVAAWFSINRKVWFGTAAMILFLTPMLFLPGRIETGYCYLPFTGLAIALAGAAETYHPAVMVAALLLFAPWELHDIRIERRDKLAKDDDARAWVTALRAMPAGPVDTFLWNGKPYGFGDFGIEAAIKCFYPGPGAKIGYYEKPPIALDGVRDAVLTWNEGLHKLDIVVHAPDTRDASYIDANSGTPVWQLGEGWSNPEGGFRWIAPDATARLDRPAGATRFEMRVLAHAALLQNAAGTVTMRVSMDGTPLAARSITKTDWQTVEWDLPPAPPGIANVAIHTAPSFHPPGDPRTLGIAVGSFGFR